MELRAHLTGAERELSRRETRRQKLVQSIVDGVPGSEVKDELIAIRARRAGESTISCAPRRLPPAWPSVRTAACRAALQREDIQKQ